MKRFKIIDYLVSIALMTWFTIAELVQQDKSFITGYFTVGGWQVISMLVHAVNGWFVKKGGTRYLYHCTAAIMLGAFILIIATGFSAFWLFFYLMALLAPFMAIFYTWLCIREIHVKMQRPLALLK